jgi:hypothetical protein
MSEISEDLNVRTIEVSSGLGVNLTADQSRINHTGNDDLSIKSGGNIVLTANEEKKVKTNNILQLKVCQDDEDRNQSSAEKGDICFMVSGTSPSASNVLQFYNGTAWVNLAVVS